MDPINLDWKIDYLNGCKKKCTNLYEILCNLILVKNKFRPAFLIQPIDYDYKFRALVFKKIYDNITMCEIYETYKIDQGILVYLNKGNSDKQIYEFIEKSIVEYSKGFYQNSFILGNILGYPYPDDITKKHLGIISLAIKNNGTIFDCVFSSSSSIDKKSFDNKNKQIYVMRDFLNSINKLPKIYVKIIYNL